jgi:hypothetical protein
MEKIFTKNKPTCKVTFSFPIDVTGDTKKLFLVGEFNDWNEENTPLTKSAKEGVFKKSLELETGRDYQFRYLTENGAWYNDHSADWYSPSGFAGIENSVVSLPKQTDDITKIEGIGPKIAVLLKEKGITTFDDIANAKAKDLKVILSEAGSKFAVHDPTSWPKQAKLAAKGDWSKLAKLQAELNAGK